MIRDGVPDNVFPAPPSRRLDATELWGRAGEYGLDTLAAVERRTRLGATGE
ncbi:hypothetical protein [Streptomyces enissocaesilis]|uniref:Uncharacterized protein n=1 Tax=Streptomyces enissocaesilis TaxID=332589 RepID=A0ABN3WUU2_9ACTN